MLDIDVLLAKMCIRDRLVDIDVNIYCERESHKGMLIGKGGAMLKKIASAVSADCEEFLGCRVNLQCWFKVKADWRDNEFPLNNFGFKQNPNNRLSLIHI